MTTRQAGAEDGQHRAAALVAHPCCFRPFDRCWLSHNSQPVRSGARRWRARMGTPISTADAVPTDPLGSGTSALGGLLENALDSESPG